MLRSLTFFVLVFGIVCTLIGAAHMVLGPGIIPGGIPVPPAMDSEDRFFGTLFIGFGLANVWCSRDIVGRGNVFLVQLTDRRSSSAGRQCSYANGCFGG